MENKFKKIACTTLSMMLGFSTVMATGCGPTADGPKVDDTKTQLYIGVYDGGFGDSFLYDFKERFEEEYKDYQFSDGTVGVQVMIRSDKNYELSKLSNGVAGWDRDIYVSAAGWDYNKLAREGALLDITDIATEKLEGEGKSIAEKMRSSYRDWFCVDGKYYGLPQYEAASGIGYDVDMFNENKLYINKNYEDSSVLSQKFSCGENDANRAYGPDGVQGTYDDGLPATFEDFFDLCERMVEKSITPVLWAGKLQSYMSAVISSLYADYEGEEKVMNHFTFSGDIDVINSFDGSGNPKIESVTLNGAENGYQGFKQPGFYYALEFLYKIIEQKDRYYDYNDCLGGGVDHLGAQEKMIYGAAEGTDKVGFIFDGPWWYNEAKGAREDFAEEFPEVEEHRYAMLPMPKVSKANLGKQTLMDGVMSCTFIPATIDEYKQDIAKKFVQFCMTNESLSEFTRSTSTTCPYEYTMSQADLEKTSYLGQSMYELHSAADYVMPLNQNAIFLKNPTIARGGNALWGTEVPSIIFQYKVENKAGGRTAREFFENMSSYYANSWSAMLP